ncbi:MAG: histidinol-phosphatase [Clostridia bacterium]|nr:histidinol-phosphatase [Clostridia bacterium]
MITRDYHTHTTFCDGHNTPREMVEAALSFGMDEIGLSGHAHQPFDFDYCMSKEGSALYREEVRALQNEYDGKIKVSLGVEKDLYSDEDTAGLDYVIGSTHYFKFGDEYYAVDAGADVLSFVIEKHFRGDALSMCEAYYENVAKIGEVIRPDIVGHFDLVTKYNDGGRFFDESAPRYVAAWQRAADTLLATCRLFEINTGAMYRVGKTRPYPSLEIISYIKERGGRFILSSDSHTAKSLCFRFDEYEHLADTDNLFE